MEIWATTVTMQSVKQGKNETKKSVYLLSKNSYVQTVKKPLNTKWSMRKANWQKLFLLTEKTVNTFSTSKAKTQIDKNI